MPNPTTPSTNIQWGAIQNGANSNSLVNQLYAGKPATQTAPVVAASSQVKNQNAPVAFNPQSVFGSTGGASTSATAPAPQTGTFNFSTTPSTLPTYNVATGSNNPLATGTLNNVTPQSTSVPQIASVTPATIQSDAIYTNPNAQSQQINTGAAGTPVTPTTTFGGIFGNLAQTSAAGSSQGQAITSNLANISTQGSAAEQNAENTLENTSAASSPAATAAQQATVAAANLNPALAQNAEDIANQYSGEIANVAQEAGGQGLGMLAGGALNPVALGRAGAISANASAEQTALAAAEQQALAGNAQGLTAANQQATAENEAGNLANTQQSNIQSGETNAGLLANTAQSNIQNGLTNAGNLANTAQQNIQTGEQAAGQLAQPSTAAYGQTVFNPVTGTYTDSSGSGDINSSISYYAQQLATGQMTMDQVPAAISGNPVLAPQLQQAAQQVNSSYNPIQSSANAASQATNLQNTSTQSQQTQQAVTYANQVLDDLSTAYANLGGGQTTGLPLINAAGNLAASSGLLGSGAAATTQGYKSAQGEALAAVTQALQSGGITPSEAGNIASSLLPPNPTPAQISSAKSYLQTFLSQREQTYTQPPAAAQYSNTSNVAGGQNVSANSIYSW